MLYYALLSVAYLMANRIGMTIFDDHMLVCGMTSVIYGFLIGIRPARST